MRDLRKDFNKLIMEALGVFALCYVGGWAVMWNIADSSKLDLAGVALAHFVVLSMFIYIGFEISGSHINPAVTIALYAAGYQKKEESIRYIIAQCIGSLSAGFVLLSTRPQALAHSQLGHPSLNPAYSQINGFFCEFIATGCLVLCVFCAGVHKKASAEVTSTCVGMSLGLMILAIGNYTGGALNPCRVLGPAFFSGRLLERGFWIYYAGTVGGGLCTGLAYKYIFIESDQEKDEVVSVALKSELQNI